MPDPQNEFSIPVDVTNPGQFYACCGLLELATATDADASGWFDVDRFTIRAKHGPKEQIANWRIEVDMQRQMVMRLSRHRNSQSRLKRIAKIEKAAEKMIKCRKGELEKANKAISQAPRLHERASLNLLKKTALEPLEAVERPAAVWLRNGEQALRADWWRHGPSGEVKTWAGGQVTIGAVEAMHKAAVALLGEKEPFDEAAAVAAKPFYFDCRSGGDAVDQGFSFDAMKNVTVLAYPVVEFLAFIGLNRFRPGGHERRVKRYATWSQPLPATLASAAAAGLLPAFIQQAYRFRLHARDASFRYKSFGRSEPVNLQENQP